MSGNALRTFHRAAAFIAAWSLAVVFALFIFGVGMRYLANRPIAWIDEAVTLLSVWSTFWTAAFVLKWPEHIAFDVIYANVKPALQRLSLLTVCTAFVLLMGAAVPGMIDYTQFLWRERTDAMQIRLDWAYSIYPIFFVVIIARLGLVIRNLISSRWQDELDRWSGSGQEASE